MKAIAIHRWDNAGRQINIKANTDDDLKVQSIALQVSDTQSGTSGNAVFTLQPGLVLPAALIDNDTLMTWSAIQAKLAQLRSTAGAAAIAELEKARDLLHANLANCVLDLSIEGFLGVKMAPGAHASLQAHLAIDLHLLDPQAPGATDQAELLKVSFASLGQVSIAGSTARTTLNVQLIVTRAGRVDAKPGLLVDADAGLKLPALDLQWPWTPWPTLDWQELDLSALLSVLRFDLPLPSSAGMDHSLCIEWRTKPQIAFKLQGSTLAIATTTPGVGTLKGGGNAIATLKGFEVALTDAAVLALKGQVQPAAAEPLPIPGRTITSPEALPFALDIAQGALAIQLDAFDLSSPVAIDITASLDLPRVLIRAKSDPNLVLALHATYEQRYDSATGASHGKLTHLSIIEPYPLTLVNLLVREAADAAQGLLRLISAIPLPSAGSPDTGLLSLLERIVAMAGAAVKWLLELAGTALDGLLGVAEAIGECLEHAMSWLLEVLKKPTVPDAHLLLEVRLDASTYALRQILLSPSWRDATPEKFSGQALGLELELPLDVKPSLLIDFDGPLSIALVALTGQAQPLRIKTDLWLSSSKTLEAVRDTDKDGKRPAKRLIEVAVNTRQPLVLFRYCAGKVSFFEQMQAKVVQIPGVPGDISSISGPVVYAPADWAALNIDVQVAPDASERLLPFLQSPKTTPQGATPEFLKRLNQYICLGTAKFQGVKNGQASLVIEATLNIAETQMQFPLEVRLDLATFRVQFTTPEKIEIKGDPQKNNFDVFGLSGKIVKKIADDKTEPFAFYLLDFSQGDVRLALAEGARLELNYGKVASGGRGLVFQVDTLGLSRSGLDLRAKVDPDEPVQLAGVDMPFRFDHGSLAIHNSQIQAFSIKGAGQLPPELVGEANATISISMGPGKNDQLIVQSAEATLDKSADPLVCHGTRFTLTLFAIGFQFQDFSKEGAGYHFYFTLSGTAQFNPRAGEFMDGLLKNFGDLVITLDKAPLARDASLLLWAIEFQVAVEPKKTVNFFNLFTFELRGIGFHPSSPAFDGAPAMSISGQMNFVEAGDIVSPRFDFHKLWIAPPAKGEWLPRVRFDGLTVGVRFGGAASIEGTAVCVDDQLPTLFKPGALPKDVTAKGFLASGQLTIKGWGQMAASMGFLELRGPSGEVRPAFFLYGQAGELSIEIPTPLGPVYLREVGFGFGFRYTLAAFNRADQVSNVKQLIEVLDDISKYQGELASIKAWEPEAEGNRLTLALRGLLSIASVSGETQYNAEGEKELSNPVLFDIVAALRSDLTFFMNARVWVSRNYADWHDSSPTATPWRTNPTLRGYVYLSVPRKEFLGRLSADGTGDVEGMHPQLPEPLVKAMKGIRWSATTYIRPGLFHQEFGWPYELGFTFKQDDTLEVVCQGGLVNRIEDMAFLYGIAFRAKGFAQINGKVGGRSFGASVVARADFSIDAKFIAYISAKRFNDTLFYGSLAFDVSILLQVRAWLEFSVGPVDVRLEVGFSMSLTLSIALEVAVSPKGLGGRACASVALGAFGRSIRLGIGLGFNQTMLESARSRCQRFLSLGLTVAMPDAEQGVAPLVPEQPRGPASRTADQAIEQVLDKHDGVSVEEVAAHIEIVPRGYWAMLFPVTAEAAEGDAQHFVLILVPRDHSTTGLEEKDLPRFVAGSEQPLGSFYAPPRGYDAPAALLPSLIIDASNIDPAVELKRLKAKPESSPKAVEHWCDKPIEVCYDVTHKTVRSGESYLLLGEFLKQCFVNVQGVLYDPHPSTVDTHARRLPQNREEAAQMLSAAAQDQLTLNKAQRQANDIEELRSSVIAALCESAANLALAGEQGWGKAVAELSLDIRSLDLAFVITRADIDRLFDALQRDNDLPRKALFSLKDEQARDQPVHLFNPPERMFSERRPKLADPVVQATASGIRLDWDLEPAFGQSQGVWHDPEFNLKHYRIERTVMKTPTTAAAHPQRQVTTKAAAPIELLRDRETGEFGWGFLRPNAQFIDDLSDLPANVREQILSSSGHDLDSLRYVVVPVDCAGTEGAPTPLSIKLESKAKARQGVRRAVLNFAYSGAQGQIRSHDHATPARPTMTLGLDDGLDDGLDARLGRDKADTWTDKDTPRRYVLRMRKERGVPSGLYGADALTDALVRPSAGDFALRRISDVDVELSLNRDRPGGDGKLPAYERPLPLGTTGGFVLGAGTRADLESLYRAIGVIDGCSENGALGVRFAIRPWHDPKLGETLTPWCPVDLTLMIDPPRDKAQPSDQPPIAAPVEVFEHPVLVDAAPLRFDDLEGEGGRVLAWHPAQSGLLADLLAQPGDGSSLVLLRDATRRVATRVRWNARPSVAETDMQSHCAKRLARLIGGFDVFEIDAGGEAEGTQNAAFTFRFDTLFSVQPLGANPRQGVVWLDNPKLSAVRELRLALSTQRADFERIDQSPERIKGHLRLVNKNGSKWIAFDVTTTVRLDTYRKLILEYVDASDAGPFSDGEQLTLMFTRLPARHVARVQALPAAMARLDPAEIADFAKVEARYPSQTRRLQEASSGRQAAWYSGAESHVAWPQPSLRSALSINVDESLLTELLSNGRPTHIYVDLQVGELHYPVSRFDQQQTSPFSASRWTVGRVRELLQNLTWDFNGKQAREHYQQKPEVFRAASVTVTARRTAADPAGPGTSLASVQFAVDLDPPLHPVLADAIDWARYERMPDAGIAILKLREQVEFDAQLSAESLKHCSQIDFTLQGWPSAHPPVLLGLGKAGKDRLSLTFSPRVQAARQQYQMLCAAMAQLTLNLTPQARRQLKKDVYQAPELYEHVELQLSWLDDQGVLLQPGFALSMSSLFTDLDTSLYRRYEPVLEPLPKTAASDIASWVGESGVERDPFGWGVLRTLGLAMGLRLYDTERRDYLPPREALQQLNQALGKALQWYAGLATGAPFIDVVTRAGGTLKITSFDGGTPGSNSADVDTLIDQDALALTQISLRPLPDRWSTRPADGQPLDKVVAYFAISKTEKSASSLVIDLRKVAQPQVVMVADVLDLTSRLARPPSQTLAALLPAHLREEQQDTALRKVLAGDAAEQSSVTLDVSHARINEVVALVRVIVSRNDAGKLFTHDAVYDAENHQGGIFKVVEINEPLLEGSGPFGRFAELGIERYNALAAVHPALIEANQALRRYAQRRWPQGWPAADAEPALLARLGQWSQRFLDHTTAHRPEPAVYFSLAEVTRPDPWRVAVQDDGTLQVLFTHDDRKRRLKRYAVKPFGRYEHFVEAIRTDRNDCQPRLPQLPGAWCDNLTTLDDMLGGRLLDIVIPRTEPLAAPVLVDARRVAIGAPQRQVLEFIYKRHAEEILAEANVTVEGALSFEGVSVGFWREFGYQGWVRRLQSPQRIDTLAAFGDWERRPPAPALLASADHFGGLAEQPGRYTDGWQGVQVLRTEALPYFFLIHAAAFASAGVVVSEPVVASIEEGDYALNLPWKPPADRQVPTPAPRWSVQRRTAEGVYVVFLLPLVRFVDAMPQASYDIWLKGAALAEVFTLPDPLARYELGTLSQDASGLSAISAQLDVMADLLDGECYRSHVVGPLFSSNGVAIQGPTRCPGSGVWWQLEVAAKLAGTPPSAQALASSQDLNGVELPAQYFGAGEVWPKVAPRTDMTVTVNAPGVDLANFQQAILHWRDAYANYLADPAAAQIHGFLQAWYAYTNGGIKPPSSLQVAGFAWGLPCKSTGRGADVTFTPRDQVEVGIAERERLTALITQEVANNPAFNTHVLVPLRAEMRRLCAARKDAEAGNRFLDFPPLLKPLPQNLATQALQLGLGRALDVGRTRLLPDSADILVAIPITAAPTERAAIIALIEAVEAARFSATAILDLGPLEEGRRNALVHLPCAALVDDRVDAALAALHAHDLAAWQAQSLLLRMPPLDEERDRMTTAIQVTIGDAATAQAMSEFVQRTLNGQLFGPGRSAQLKVYRGTAHPVTHLIERAPGGYPPCQ